MRAGIIGAGLCGLSAAIRLAQQGVDVELFEAAPAPGGRTRSFFDPAAGHLVDNGPHLISGAYRDTIALLSDAGASGNIDWQESLTLPLWDAQRGHFLLRANPWLPLALALPLACAQLPGHGWKDIPALIRLARLIGQPVDSACSVDVWLQKAHIPPRLFSDLLEPLCLGAMNDAPADANAASFRHVLQTAFADHGSAKLGWFNMPLSQGLIEPLLGMAQSLGVQLHCGCRVRGIRNHDKGIELDLPRGPRRFDSCILALPLRSAQRLLGRPGSSVTRRISNIHMWFRNLPALPHPFIGGIGTTGQWFFDVSSQMPGLTQANAAEEPLRHICAVISADMAALQGEALLHRVRGEFEQLHPDGASAELTCHRIVSEHHATTSVMQSAPGAPLFPGLPCGLIEACESPHPGGYPSTIEYAVARGSRAAKACYSQLIS